MFFFFLQIVNAPLNFLCILIIWYILLFILHRFTYWLLLSHVSVSLLPRFQGTPWLCTYSGIYLELSKQLSNSHLSSKWFYFNQNSVHVQNQQGVKLLAVIMKLSKGIFLSCSCKLYDNWYPYLLLTDIILIFYWIIMYPYFSLILLQLKIYWNIHRIIWGKDHKLTKTFMQY